MPEKSQNFVHQPTADDDHQEGLFTQACGDGCRAMASSKTIVLAFGSFGESCQPSCLSYDLCPSKYVEGDDGDSLDDLKPLPCSNSQGKIRCKRPFVYFCSTKLRDLDLRVSKHCIWRRVCEYFEGDEVGLEAVLAHCS